MKINKRLICGFELTVILLSLFSFSYMLNLGTANLNQDSLKTLSEYRKEKVSFFETILVAFFGKLKEPMIPLTSAEEVVGCCALAPNGNQCATTSAANCAVGAQFAPYQTCAETSFCKPGCCFDNNNVNFDEMVLRTTCEVSGQNWIRGSCNSIPESRNGCCVIGSDTFFENQAKCELRTEQSAIGGNNVDWRSDLDELGCFATAERAKVGACVFETGLCRFQTEAECYVAGGDFHENLLCTARVSDIASAGVTGNVIGGSGGISNCERTTQTTCVDGKDEVYFVDSCGNTANVYDSSRVNDVDYWGVVVPSEDSCEFGATDGNANSATCGNCNAGLGGACALASGSGVNPTYGDFYCKDTTCEFEGEDYENGESWCAYDGKIGDGDDFPGSRHFRYLCNKGEVDINPCADFRGEVCVQSDFADEEETIPMKSARCELNEANTCFTYNNDEGELTEDECAESFEILDKWKKCLPSETESEDSSATITTEQKTQECNSERDVAKAGMTSDEDFDLCLEKFEESDYTGRLRECDLNPACFVNNVDIADDFNFELCSPKYPIGFNKNDEGSVASAQAICATATATCTVQYEPKTFGGCKLVSNGDCLKEDFSEKMNNFCRSLGDCGADVNYNEQYSSSGYSVENAPKLSIDYVNRLVDILEGGTGEEATTTGNAVAGSNSGTNVGAAEAVDQNGHINALGGKEQLSARLLGENYGFGGTYVRGINAQHESQNEGTTSGATGNVIARITGNAMFNLVSAAECSTCVKPAPASSTSCPTCGAANKGAGADAASEFSMSSFATAAMGAAAGYFLGQMLAEELELSEGGSLLFTIGSSLVGSSLATLLVGGSLPGLGWAILGVGVLLMIIGSLFGGSDCDPIEVKFECKPWQPPIGGSSCDVCNNDPNKPCSEYRCSSLGAACVFINPGTGKELCVEDDPNDVTPPTIERDADVNTGDGNIISETPTGFKIESENGGCLEAYSDLTIGLVTDEPSWCKADIEVKPFEEMQEDFGSNIFARKHSITIPLQDPSHGESHGISWNADTRLYIKCLDRHGTESVGEYTIEFCVNQGDDITAPSIEASEPASGRLVGFDSTSKAIKIMTDELSTCKWDAVDQDYSTMANSFECNDEYLHQSSIYGYVCTATLPTTATENKYYIRCMDQPWLVGGENEDKRTAMSTSYEYILRKPTQKIKIDYAKPNTDFESGVDVNQIILEVGTSGGGNLHTCSYSTVSYQNMIDFFETGISRIHKQTQNLLAGEYRYYLKCRDETGDYATAETSFRIIRDTSAPQVARVWKTGGTIYIITTEPAECKYTTTGCGFAWNSGSNAGNGLIHTISSTRGQTYSIKCKDGFGNLPDGCSVQVRSG